MILQKIDSNRPEMVLWLKDFDYLESYELKTIRKTNEILQTILSLILNLKIFYRFF